MNLKTPFLFHTLSIAVGVCMLVSAIAGLTVAFNFVRAIHQVYFFIFGVAVIVSDLVHLGWIEKWLGFMYSFLGRAMLFLFFGFFIIEDSGLRLAMGIIVIVIAVIFFILYFIPGIGEYPSAFYGSTGGGSAAAAAGGGGVRSRKPAAGVGSENATNIV